MILDERTYLILPAHLADYLRIYEQEGMAIQVGHLGELVGWFTTDSGGRVNEVVHIWRYAGAGDRELRRAAMEADPAWQAFRKKTSGFVLEMRSRILRPTSFSPMK
jgi:hypothetical protein